MALAEEARKIADPGRPVEGSLRATATAAAMDKWCATGAPRDEPRGWWQPLAVKNCPESGGCRREEACCCGQAASDAGTSFVDIVNAKTAEATESILLKFWEGAGEEHQLGVVSIATGFLVVKNTWSLAEAMLGVLVWEFFSRQARYAAADVLAWICLDPHCGLMLVPVEILKHLNRLVWVGSASSIEYSIRAVRNLAGKSPEYCEVRPTHTKYEE